jgi:hypothetical protein
MEQIRQKKIRKLLISYTNEQIKYSKKVQKINILINSTPLEELEKKNMKCKEFFIQEKTETYQNIDNRRSIIQNICINNNSYYSNIIITWALTIDDSNNIKFYANGTLIGQ